MTEIMCKRFRWKT